MSPPLLLIRSLLVRVPPRAWLWAFLVAILTELTAISAGFDALRWVSKPALTILLLGYLIVSVSPGRRPARWMGLGLLLACAADIALLVEGEPAFLTGMGLFGAMQIVYIGVFVRLGALAPLRRRWLVPGAYLAFWLGANVVLWPRLEALAVPIAVYSLLLVSMGAVSSGLGRISGLGGLLFVVSDLILGMGVAGFDLPLEGQAVMATYAAAQLLLVIGCVRAVNASGSPSTAAAEQ
ncbi:lysoplasmalogenase [Glycomyces paridis]|uniref:Lysoplasmalogenase n=1 Tax=Glycomyces paridis TaxID=2126555 RepID=A0A4S8PMZ5_9ACTN|nr:lysoplasmalogenase [Glycomyces paridis]THV32147.1 lysoplasmalogenase [Glycomyces paridis]